MDGPVATVTVPTTGLHRVSIWMREDGTRLDKVLLTEQRRPHADRKRAGGERAVLTGESRLPRRSPQAGVAEPGPEHRDRRRGQPGDNRGAGDREVDWRTATPSAASAAHPVARAALAMRGSRVVPTRRSHRSCSARQ